MSETSLLTLPANRVVNQGTKNAGYFVLKRKVETAANMLPGALVVRGTNDDDIVVAGDESAVVLGVLGFKDADGQHQPDTITTVYAVDAFAPVLRGNFIGRGILAAAQTVVAGSKLQAAANGELKLLNVTPTAADNASTYATALESSSGGEAILVHWSTGA